MLKNREELNKIIDNEVRSIAINDSYMKKAMSIALRNHNIEQGFVFDIFTAKKNIREYSDFIAYVIAECIDKCKETNYAQEYFTQSEIIDYRKHVYKEGSALSLPIELEMLKIADDQYIGRTDTRFLMKLREAGLITYNKNTQRSFRRKIKNHIEVYELALSKQAVRSIKKNFLKGVYIPNMITFNISMEPDRNNSFQYDEERRLLIIDELDSFDILDGYHRYVALCSICDEDPEFNYPMELKIVNFSEDKARRFVFQEDQKTKMRKVDSESFNPDRYANIVCEQLNEDPGFYYCGQLNRADGYIPFGDFADLVNHFYFRDKKSEKSDRKEIFKIENEIKQKFNCLAVAGDYDRRFSKLELGIILEIFDVAGNDLQKIPELVEVCFKSINEIDKKKFSTWRSPAYKEIRDFVNRKSS